MSPIPIYALTVGPTVSDVHRQKKIHSGHFGYERCPQHLFSILPITMNQLPGTEWRNIHTYATETIDHIAEDRYGKPGPDPEKHMMVMHSIGLWMSAYRSTTEIFCVLDWVRVDNLPAKDKVDWAKERVAHCRSELARSKTREQNADRLNIRLRKTEVKWRERDLSDARSELSALCDRLGFSLPTSVMNVGALPGDQLALF